MVTVPIGYIQAEAKYTIKESGVFSVLGKLGESIALETARTAVLEKRIEFHALYLTGKVKIPSSRPRKKRTWRTWILWFFLGQKQPDK